MAVGGSLIGPRRFTRIAFSPDGERLAVAVATAAADPSSPVPLGQRLLLLDMPAGRIVWQRRYPMHPGQNEVTPAFAPNGTLVTSAWWGETLLWKTGTGRVARRFGIGGSLAVSPDGRFVALGRNSRNPANPSASLVLLDLLTGRRRSLNPLPAQGWIVSVAFTPDGKHVVGASFEGAVRVWSRASGSILQTFARQPSGRNLAVTPDGSTVLSGGANGSVAAWDLSRPLERR